MEPANSRNFLPLTIPMSSWLPANGRNLLVFYNYQLIDYLHAAGIY